MGVKQRPVRVIICDDQTILRQYAETLVSSSKNYILVRSSDSASFVDGYCACGYVDLLLLSVVLRSGPDPLEVAQYVKRKFPRIRIIIMSQFLDTSLMDRAKSIGVDAFWYKEHQELPLMDLMELVTQGQRCFPEKVPCVKLGISMSEELTNRELDVLRLLSLGYSDRDIGNTLEIKPSTVRAHIKHLMEKTGFSTRTELAVQATLSHLISP